MAAEDETKSGGGAGGGAEGGAGGGAGSAKGPVDWTAHEGVLETITVLDAAISRALAEETASSVAIDAGGNFTYRGKRLFAGSLEVDELTLCYLLQRSGIYGYFEPRYLSGYVTYLRRHGVTRAVDPYAGRGYVPAFLAAAGLPTRAFDIAPSPKTPRFWTETEAGDIVPEPTTVFPVTAGDATVKSGWYRAITESEESTVVVISWPDPGTAENSVETLRLVAALPQVTHLLICTEEIGVAMCKKGHAFLGESDGFESDTSDSDTTDKRSPFVEAYDAPGKMTQMTLVHPYWRLFKRAPE